MRWRSWIIWLLLPWLAACSTLRLGYNQAPTLAYWWLDSYADFSAEQSPRVKDALADWLAWHRATQLTDYAQALAMLGTMAVNPVTAEQLCSQVTAWQQRADRAVDRAVPALAAQLRTLSVEQINHLERKQAAKREDQAAEFLQARPADRQKAAFERLLSRAETVYGKLDEPQRKQLGAAQQASPFQAEIWLAEVRLRHADLVRSLRQWQAERADSATVEAGLRRLAADTLRSPRPEYRAYADKLKQANCALMAQVHNSSTPVQRQRAVSTFKGWEDDLRALADPR